MICIFSGMSVSGKYTENSSRIGSRMGSKRRKSIHGKGGSIANTSPLSVDRFLTAFNPILEPILELFSVYRMIFFEGRSNRLESKINTK
jgi:hypothetical protein